MKKQTLFLSGFRNMLPITTGIIPFGAVVGTVCAEAKLSFFKSIVMNNIVFAGASQLVAVDLMTKKTVWLVVVITGLIINLRFILYSAALSPIVHRSSFLVKLFCSYCLTDQGYAVMSANQDKFRNNTEAISFYIGASICMILTWQASFVAGYAFGNFAPAALSLDFAVPLSFIALVIPTMKNKNYLIVALFASVTSILLNPLPYKLGLILTAFSAILLAAFLTKKKVTA
ncbi:MAG: AzlC family ABC transporter permease [Pseudobdellovibrio sp.]